MKTRSKAALLLLALFLAGATFAPMLLRLDRVQSVLIGRLQKEMPFAMRLDAMSWHWWPLPHLSVRGLRIDSSRWQLVAPTAEFHPAWTAFLGQGRSMGRVILKQPAVRILEGVRKKPPRLPPLTLTVEDGSLLIPAGDLPSPVKSQGLRIAGIDGRIDLSPGEVAVRASATSPFFQKIKLQGHFRPPTRAYRFQMESRGLEIHKIISSLAGGRIFPGRSNVNLKGTIKGVGLANFRADLTGEFPCFLVRPHKQSLPITCGFADLGLRKSGSTLTLAIKSLDLKNPRLKLQGKVVRTWPDKAKPPQWEMDLTARDLDLARIREKALAMLGNERLIQKVAEVVRGGTAPVLRFRFTGPAAGLRHLKAITIEGRLKDARLHVPKIDLDPDKVSGDFTIRQGRLSACNIQGQLGSSKGRNGKLLLALTGKEKEFLFDLDVEAEVAELPAVLHHTVHKEAFLREVDRFSDLDGRIRGHLHLGDRLHHPVADVTVDDLKASGRYARLPWPFQFQGGRLEVVSNRQVSWQKVKAVIGPHRVAETTGDVSWGEGIRLDVDSLQASLAAGPLYQELDRYPVVRRKLSSVLSAITGRIGVAKGAFHGPLHRPDQWHYALGIEGEDLVWNSPRLGESVSTRRMSGSISDQEAVVTASDNVFLGQRLSLRGRFQHRQLAHWHGWVEINGIAGHRLASWVKKKRWVPPAFFPRIPCVMDGLRIGWGPGHLAVSGGVVAGDRPQGLPRVDFDLRKTGKDFVVKRMTITAAHEHGLLMLDLPKSKSAGFALNWQGRLDGRTVDALLESNRLLYGRVAGICSLHYAPGQPRRTRLVGTLRADDVRLPLPGPPLIIKQMELNGDGANLDIPLLEMDLAGEQASAKGRVMVAAHGLDLDLALTSPVLSWSTLVKLRKSFGRKKAGGGRWGNWDLRGRIRFDIAEFRYAWGEAASGEKKTGYRWQPLEGTIDLQPGNPWQIGVDKAGICGLSMNGTWSSKGGGTSLVHLWSDPQAPPAFEKVMPCLGHSQDLLVGPFSLNVTLHGRPGRWTGGQARLQSTHGNIRRLTLLSKIFRVINLTDLFTDAGPSPVAGGLPYSTMDLEARVADNRLVFDKAVVRGEGLNLFGSGSLDLSTFQADLTILIEPFKTIDAIVSSVPVIGRVIGRVIGGKNATLVTIPVGVKGPISDPSVMVLSPEAVGKSLLSLVKNTISLPFTLLSPIFSGGK